MLIGRMFGMFERVVRLDDGRPDVALASSGQGPVKIAVFQNTGRPERPFGDSPDMTLDLDALP